MGEYVRRGRKGEKWKGKGEGKAEESNLVRTEQASLFGAAGCEAAARGRILGQ